MSHKPCRSIRPSRLSGFVVNAPKIAPQLVCTDALFGRAHQVNRQEPLVKRDVRVLENRANGYGEWFTARRTFVQTLSRRLASQPVRFPDDPAVRANGTIRPHQPL